MLKVSGRSATSGQEIPDLVRAGVLRVHFQKPRQEGPGFGGLAQQEVQLAELEIDIDRRMRNAGKDCQSQ
jgi:hypothetical protein